MTASAIEWTDRVWNPVTGCRKVSAGCEHCYAEGVARRFWRRQYPAGVTIPTPADGIAPDDARYLTLRCLCAAQSHEDRIAAFLEPHLTAEQIRDVVAGIVGVTNPGATRNT